MANLGRILIADDEETFSESTAELLRRQGYRCDCAPDAATAAEKLRNNDYDLLIADINMPGNPKLELIRDMPKIAEGMPVILITGYPSLGSAIQSIELPVESYLVKPIDFEQLLAHVRIAVEHFRLYRSVHRIKQRLQYWYESLGSIEELLKNDSQEAILVSLDTFLELTFQNIVDAVSDLKHVIAVLAEQTKDKQPCHLFNCPRLESLTNGLAETVNVLKGTKSAFKSKNLGEIRRKLEVLIQSKP